ncbi:MAG: hotdog fold thioesterase [Alphaproteobacteria bacterium]|nr:hotdog fold thioesterase [Alphaproteobacteria bacterium]
MSAAETTGLGPYRVEAFNTAEESENKIHDNDVARQFGFSGGLVPGVDVYAYMTHLPVQRWGRAWLEHGAATCRFNKPVYDGDVAVVAAQETEDGLTIEVTSRDEICAIGTARLPKSGTPPSLAEFAVVAVPETRPAANETSLAQGLWLNTRPVAVTADLAARYLSDLRETETLYTREGIAHPGLILRLCNWALSHNVVLGPWIHTGSVVRHLGIARIGETLTARARVTDNDDRKGHQFVDLDVLVLADERPVASVQHTAIWRPRQLEAA